MDKEKIKLTIEIKRDLLHRIEEAVKYIDLANKFEGTEEEIDLLITEHDFIVGSIKEVLNQIETFSEPVKNKISNKDIRPLKNSIKFHLQKRNIKQIEIAQMLNVDKSNLSMYLNNYKQPPIDMFLDIWAILDYPPINNLLYREDENSNNSS